MANDKMEVLLKKLSLSGHRARFLEEKISTDVVYNILCVSDRIVLRRMVEYDLKIRNFFNISDEQLDSDVLALPNHYQFCGETILRKLLIGRGITIQHYQFRDSMHSICKVGIQSRRKCRLKEGYITQKRANHLWHIDTNHKLVE